jgi:hypothetical protein
MARPFGDLQKTSSCKMSGCNHAAIEGEQQMKNRLTSSARNAFNKLEIRYVDLKWLAAWFDDIQTSVAISLRENFGRLPDKEDPDYGDAANAAAQKHCSFVSDRMEGLIYEIEDIIHDAQTNIVFLINDAAKKEQKTCKVKKKMLSRSAPAPHDDPSRETA